MVMKISAIVRHGIECVELEFQTDKLKGGGARPLQSGVVKNAQNLFSPAI